MNDKVDETKTKEEFDFQYELEKLINKCSMENGCDTPDYILALYLCRCLESFNEATNRREEWYGRKEPDLLNTNSGNTVMLSSVEVDPGHEKS